MVSVFIDQPFTTPASVGIFHAINATAICNFPSTLLKAFGCADVIAPVDDVGLGKIAGELIFPK